MTTAIKIDKLSFCYRKHLPPVLNEIELTVEKGQMVGLIGPNGAGKSTLLNLINGYLRPTQGTISIMMQDTTRVPPHQLARWVATAPQNPQWLFPYTVEEMVVMGLFPGSRGVFFESPTALLKVDTVLRELDLEFLRSKSVLELSGGEAQRTLLARTLVQDTPLVLLDEPTANLDLKHQLQLFQLLHRRVVAEKAVLLATHDINLCALFCQRLLLLHKGQLVAQGTPAQIIRVENFRNVFEVDIEVMGAEEGTPQFRLLSPHTPEEP